MIVAYYEITIDNPKEFKIIQDNTSQTTMNPISAIRNFKTEFWLLTIVYCSTYCTVLPYINFSSEFLFKTKFKSMVDRNLAEEESALFTGGCFIVCAILDPVLGLIQKKVGLRPYLLLFSTCLGISAIFLFFVQPMIGIINIGLSNSILSTVFWIAIGIVVDKKEEVIINLFLLLFY